MPGTSRRRGYSLKIWRALFVQSPGWRPGLPSTFFSDSLCFAPSFQMRLSGLLMHDSAIEWPTWLGSILVPGREAVGKGERGGLWLFGAAVLQAQVATPKRKLLLGM